MSRHIAMLVALTTLFPAVLHGEAHMFVDVRSGRGVDAAGSVPDAQRTRVFMTGDDIHLALELARDVDTAANIGLRVYVADDGRLVWSAAGAPSTAPAPVHFTIPAGELGPGSYQAVFTLGAEPTPENMARHRFEVRAGEVVGGDLSGR